MKKKYKLKIFNRIDLLDRQSWDQCNKKGNLFTSYNFLKLLEDSNSLLDRTGWYPSYFSWHDKNSLKACVASYEKVNSQGEFVFDHSWANVFKRVNLSYYPKLVIASPFTPITGKRILINDDANISTKRIIIDDIKNFFINKNLLQNYKVF